MTTRDFCCILLVYPDYVVAVRSHLPCVIAAASAVDDASRALEHVRHRRELYRIIAFGVASSSARVVRGQQHHLRQTWNEIGWSRQRLTAAAQSARRYPAETNAETDSATAVAARRSDDVVGLRHRRRCSVEW